MKQDEQHSSYEEQFEQLDDDETMDSPQRRQFLDHSGSGSREGLDYDSDEDRSPAMTPRKTPVAFRAYSPSPIRKRGSLLDLFNTNIDSNMALTYGGNMAESSNV